MKKTLIIATMALGFVANASGETLATYDASELAVGNGTLTLEPTVGGGGYGNVYLSMALDVEALTTAITSSDLSATNIMNVKGSGGNRIGVGARTYNTQTGLWGSWNDTINQEFNGTSTGLLGVEQTHTLKDLATLFTENTYEAAALTILIAGAGEFAHLTLVSSEGTTTTISAYNSGLKASGFGTVSQLTYNTDMVEYVTINTALESEGNWMQNSPAAQTVNLATLEAAKSANVPEPATATLSLLALAGLAARRRRK